MKALNPKQAVVSWPPFDKKLIQIGSNGQSGVELDKQGDSILTGMWEAEANVTSWLTYPCHEFMVLLEGEVCVITPTETHTFGPGDAFVIPLGTKCVWTNVGRVRKWFVAGFDGVVARGENKIFKIDPFDPKHSFAISNTLLLFATTTGLQIGLRKIKAGEAVTKRVELDHIVDGYCDGETFLRIPGHGETAFSKDVMAIFCSYDVAKTSKL